MDNQIGIPLVYPLQALDLPFDIVVAVHQRRLSNSRPVPTVIRSQDIKIARLVTIEIGPSLVILNYIVLKFGRSRMNDKPLTRVIQICDGVCPIVDPVAICIVDIPYVGRVGDVRVETVGIIPIREFACCSKLG
ncbi:MAG TPA: hypothetical protein PKN00_15430 [Sedimentisphaerales bacterium]|nr:hypothetical protein [Sedimentisphaerales bacterium]